MASHTLPVATLASTNPFGIAVGAKMVYLEGGKVDYDRSVNDLCLQVTGTTVHFLGLGLTGSIYLLDSYLRRVAFSLTQGNQNTPGKIHTVA